jgi:hypothetical protein
LEYFHFNWRQKIDILNSYGQQLHINTLEITSHLKPLNRQNTTDKGVEIQIPDLDMHNNVAGVKPDNGLPPSDNGISNDNIDIKP